MLAWYMLVLTGYTRIDPNFFLANRHEPLAYTSSFRVYQCHSETSVLLDCVYNSTYYGISYASTCTPHGVLCCPNGTFSNWNEHAVPHPIIYCSLYRYSVMFSTAVIWLPSNISDNTSNNTSKNISNNTSNNTSDNTSYSNFGNIITNSNFKYISTYTNMYTKTACILI